MTNEPRDKIYGTLMSEHIALIPGELPRDAVGLWQIVPAGRDGFGLHGAALTDFVRRGIGALLDAGAVPVRHDPASAYEWDQQKQYGSSSEGIISAVIAEWLKMPDDPLVLCGEGVWFARPRPGKLYVKIV